MSWAGAESHQFSGLQLEIFPKGHQKTGPGKDLGLVEPRPMTLEQSAFPSTCCEYLPLAATLHQTAAEPL